MKNRYLLFISVPILAITLSLSGLFKVEDAQKVLKKTSVDEAKIYDKAKNIAYKYFMKLYKTYKNSEIEKMKPEVEKLKKSEKDKITEFGKISVYFTKAYLILMKELKPKNPDKFKKIKKTPDQMADKLFELGANPFEIKKAAQDAAGLMGINADKWEKMLDKGKAVARE